MREIGAKAEPALELLGKRSCQRVADLLKRPASLADKVLVHAAGPHVVDTGGMTQMRVADHTDFLECGKRAVNGRRTDRRQSAADARHDLVGRGMAGQSGDGLQCHLTLRCAPQPV